MVFEYRIVFLNSRLEWNNDRFLVKGEEGGIYLVGCLFVWEGGFEIDIWGRGRKNLD